MSNFRTVCQRIRLPLGIFIMTAVANGVFAKQYKDYKTRYDADEALLEELAASRRDAWIQFQLDTIRKRYSSQTDDIQFLNAAYLPSPQQRTEALKKIGATSSRYGEAQLMLAREFRKPEEQLPYLEKAYSMLKDEKSKPEKAKVAQQLLITVLVEVGTKKSIERALDLIKKTTGGDKRYMQWQSARLQLILADKAKEETGTLSDAQKTMVKGVVDALIKSDVFWQNDYIAMHSYSEMAHAYVLLNKPAEAYKQLSAPFENMVEMTKQFPKKLRIHSPEVPAKFYLAKAFVQMANKVKSGKMSPPKKRVKDGKKTKLVPVSKEEGYKFYLKRAFNTFQYELQESDIAKSRLSRKALMEADTLRKVMEAQGMKVPPPDPKQLQRIAWGKAVDFYSEDKYAEAIPHFEVAAGKDRDYRGDKVLDSLFYLTICYARTDKFKEAIDSAKMATLKFKAEERAWDCVYLVGTEALKAASAIRKKDAEKYAEYKKIASDMFEFIVKNNDTYSKIEGAIYQRGNDLYGEAIEIGKARKEAQKELEKAINENMSGNEIASLKKTRDEKDKAMKQAYLESAKPYKLLLENYSSSKYCTKAIYRLAWVYLLVDEKPEAIKYFKMYCERDKTPTADYIDSKYWMANSYYSEEDWENALKFFDEIITLTNPKDPKFVLPERGAKSAQKRILKARKKALALKPWVYVQWGEEYLDMADTMEDEVKELDSLIKTYDAAIAEAEKDNKETVQLPPASAPPIPKTAKKTFEKGKQPKDYAFNDFLLRSSSAKVDMISRLPDDVHIRMKDGLVWVTKNHDTVGEIGGKGFDVTIDGDALNWLSANKKIACYRDGKLVFVYDPSAILAEPAKEGEAPEELELPPFNQAMLIKEAKIRQMVMSKQRAANNKRVGTTRDGGLKLQEQALEGLRYYVDNYKKDLQYSPKSLEQIAKIHVNQKSFNEAAKALSELQNKYPSSPSAKQAGIIYFRTIMNALEKERDPAKRKELMTKADTQAKSIIKTISTLSLSNLKRLGFRLFKKDKFGEMTNVSPELTAAALEELMKRADKNPNLDRLRERAMYFKGLSLYLAGDYEGADKQMTLLIGKNDKTAYLFKAMLLRSKALRKMKKLGDSIGVVNKVIRKTSASRERFKEEYWSGVLEMCRTLLEKKESGARTAKLWLEQCIGLDKNDKDVQWIREAAFYELVRAHLILDEKKQAEKRRTEYLLNYRGGPWTRPINKLN